MKFCDIGFIIQIKKHSEKSAVVKLLSSEHGIYNGYVKNAFSKNNLPIFQVGNLISFEWRSRVEEGLGNFYYCDIVKSYAGAIMFDKLRLNCLQSIITLINNNFYEREPLIDFYHKFEEFINNAIDDSFSDQDLLANYITIEYEILAQLGFGLDLSSCAVSSMTEDLVYVSPKSGRAVSKSVGEPYKDKVLSLPAFIHSYANALTVNTDCISSQDLVNGLKLTGYFLEKSIACSNNNKHGYRSIIVDRLREG